MCGIVGILGSSDAAPRLVDALRRLEYRGYDSAGIATLNDSHIRRRRAEGKLQNLADRLASEPLKGSTGIGHTRWATHGAPTEGNAHPHATERVAIVHNGIIENFRELRAEVEAAGRKLASDTDTEVIAHLMTIEIDRGATPVDAMRITLAKLQGAFALAAIFDGDDDLMIVARRGSPLAIGLGQGEMFAGSDAIALAPFTNRVIYLEDGDWAVLTHNAVTIYDEANEEVVRPAVATPAAGLLVDKGNYRHFMAKEIAEQPEVVGHTLAHYLDFAAGKVALPDPDAIDFAGARPAVDHRLRHRLLRRAGRQILVRAPGTPAGRRRYRLRVPLSRNAAEPQRRLARHLAVRRDRGHAGVAALCQGGGPEDRRHRQRPPVDDRARIRTSSCRRSPAPRSVSPRRRPSPASSRFWRRSPSPPARRAASCQMPTRRTSSTRFPKCRG